MVENHMIKLTEAQIRKVAEETGASIDYVKSVAEWVPGSLIRFTIIKAWACLRCVTCLGLARKVFWCIVCVATKPPEI